VSDQLPAANRARNGDIYRPALQVHGISCAADALIFRGCPVRTVEREREAAPLAKRDQFCEKLGVHVFEYNLPVAREFGWLEVWGNEFRVRHGLFFPFTNLFVGWRVVRGGIMSSVSVAGHCCIGISGHGLGIMITPVGRDVGGSSEGAMVSLRNKIRKRNFICRMVWPYLIDYCRLE